MGLVSFAATALVLSAAFIGDHYSSDRSVRGKFNREQDWSNRGPHLRSPEDDDLLFAQLEVSLSQLTPKISDATLRVAGATLDKLDEIEKQIITIHDDYDRCFKILNQMSDTRAEIEKPTVDAIQVSISTLQSKLAIQMVKVETDRDQKTQYQIAVNTIKDGNVKKAKVALETLNYPKIAVVGILNDVYKDGVDTCKNILAFLDVIDDDYETKAYGLLTLNNLIRSGNDRDSYTPMGSDCSFQLAWFGSQWISLQPGPYESYYSNLEQLVHNTVRLFTYDNQITIRQKPTKCKFANPAEERKYKQTTVGDRNTWMAQTSVLMKKGHNFVLIDQNSRNVLESNGNAPFLTTGRNGDKNQMWKPILDKKGLAIQHVGTDKFLFPTQVPPCYKYDLGNTPFPWFVEQP